MNAPFERPGFIRLFGISYRILTRFVDGVMNAFSLQIESPSYHYAIQQNAKRNLPNVPNLSTKSSQAITSALIIFAATFNWSLLMF